MEQQSVLIRLILLLLSRITSMALGFAVFLIFVEWLTPYDLGVFRTLMTYTAVTDTLAMLGVQTWIAAIIGGRVGETRKLCIMGGLFALIVAVFVGCIYFGISRFDIYSPDINQGLRLILLLLPASAMLLCNNAVLVGSGYSDQFAKLLLIENVLRFASCLFIIIYQHGAVLTLINYYIVIRWFIVLSSYYFISKYSKNQQWGLSLGLFKEIVAKVPVYFSIISAALISRYAAGLIIPALLGTEKAGTYAACYQLYDLTLIGSTVLSLTLNYTFAARAQQSLHALFREVRTAILAISAYILPVTTLAITLADTIIAVLYNNKYESVVMPLRILMMSASVISIDQVIATALLSANQSRVDLKAVTTGAFVTILLTYPALKMFDIEGACLVQLFATLSCLFIRITLISYRLKTNMHLWILLRRSITISILVSLIVYFFIDYLKTFPIVPWLILSSGLTMGLLLTCMFGYLFGFYKPSNTRRFKKLYFARKLGVS